VIQQVLQTWKATDVKQIVVVVRSSDQELAGLCSASGVTVVQPIVDPPDMKASIQQALHFVAAEAKRQSEPLPDAWLLAPADMPHLSVPVVQKLLHEYETVLVSDSFQGSSPIETACRPQILVPTFQGQRGHPVLFSWSLVEEVFALGEQEGVNRLLQRHVVRELVVSEPMVVEDLDTPDDYRRLNETNHS
jgi:molybdenum cofactor cytidylyltransferase